MNTKRIIFSAVLTFFLLVCTVYAGPIQNAPGSELNLYTIYNTLFNAGLLNNDGLNNRVHSYNGLWYEFDGGVKVRATYAGDTQNLWTALPDKTLGAPIITAFGATDGIDTSFSNTGTNYPSGQAFQWVGDSSGGPQFYSFSPNSDGKAHFVAIKVLQSEINYFNTTFSNDIPTNYAIEGLVWFLGYEDRVGGDFDFNDLAFLTYNSAPVPEPISMLLFGTGLVGVGGFIRRKFKK